MLNLVPLTLLPYCNYFKGYWPSFFSELFLCELLHQCHLSWFILVLSLPKMTCDDLPRKILCGLLGV